MWPTSNIPAPSPLTGSPPGGYRGHELRNLLSRCLRRINAGNRSLQNWLFAVGTAELRWRHPGPTPESLGEVLGIAEVALLGYLLDSQVGIRQIILGQLAPLGIKKVLKAGSLRTQFSPECPLQPRQSLAHAWRCALSSTSMYIPGGVEDYIA